MQKKQTLSYDQTKRMLNTLRKLNESKNHSGVIKEQSQEQRNSLDTSSFPEPSPESQEETKDDVVVVNDVDIKLVSSDDADMELKEDQKTAISGIIDSFREQVSQIAEFEPGFTVSSNQIRLDGSISEMDINYVLIAGEESGLYLNADMLKMDEEVFTIIDKLVKFEQSFKDAMEPIIRYRKNN